jgi:hypothetical protein
MQQRKQLSQSEEYALNGSKSEKTLKKEDIQLIELDKKEYVKVEFSLFI